MITVLDVAWIKELKKNSPQAKKIAVQTLRVLKNHINGLFPNSISKTLKVDLVNELSAFLQDKEIDDTYVPDIYKSQPPERPPDPSDMSPVSQLKDEYGFRQSHVTCNYLERPDVILRVKYFCEDTGLYKQRCVICEVDGNEKTTPNRTLVDGGHPIKLALKLMTSTSAQAVLQDETYHIRSNFHKYLDSQIQKSLFATTNVELPEFQTFIENLQQKGDDLKTVRTGIHLVHHLFLSHVKIAFLIHMRVVHGIDMLTTDGRDSRMRDHFFFVNFEGSHLPNKLVFEEALGREAPDSKLWLESHWMLHTRVKIKCHNDDKKKSEWVMAPVVNASSSKARMKTWSARVRGMSLPNFPFEESSFMPIACATVQRVNMAKLCEIVKQASQKALDSFYEARLLYLRPNPFAVLLKTKIKRREFADYCFLTRRQQLDRNEVWNESSPKLRKQGETKDNDFIEFNFGYEHPERIRDYSYSNDKVLDPSVWHHWDQIDVRMYYFDKEMKNTGWEEEAAGMWYIQDYIDFMRMLQTLNIKKQPNLNTDMFEDFCEEANFCFPNFTRARYDDNEMPKPLEVQDRAHHQFSILAWFFDCRDAGACGYQWEDFVLEYFGAYIEGQERNSEFEKFTFSDLPTGEHYTYFNQKWFQICVFLEHNFRNAIAPMHYKLYEMTHGKSIGDLQKHVKSLYNQRQSMFNQRSCFEGLGFRAPDGSIVPCGGSFLSFQRFDARTNPNMTLRERVFSQLHDELPELDPTLLKYVQQFRIPDAELFLRMIRCPNVLALRELAVQHRHLLGGQGTASSVQPEFHIQQTLKYFPVAVQSEILYMLKFVERDDSVFVHAPAIPDSKKVMLPQSQMRQWIRETLEVNARVQTLGTPLQLKCYMFTMPELNGGGVAGFSVLKRLFYTTGSMMNAGSKRSIVFVLLQMHIALEVLKSARADQGIENDRDNPLAQLLGLEVVQHGTYEVDFLKFGDKNVRWTVGSSLTGWPKRDQNEFVLRRKESPIPGDKTLDVFGMKSTQVTGKGVISTVPGLPDGEAYCMREKERCLWLLLLYARPGVEQFVAEDNTVVSREQERMEDGCRETRDITTARLSYEIRDRLHVRVYDDDKAVIFFEKMRGNARCVCTPFPSYIEEIISDIPDRSLIYVPKTFAQELRKNFSSLHSKVFEYDNSQWRMVCVGVRAWAWKRLLVKSIFLDSLAKIMTRSSLQLSLYCPTPGSTSLPADKKYMDDVLGLHKDAKEVFGSLEHKKNIMQNNKEPKKTQLLFTLHVRKWRVGHINDVETDLYEKVSRSHRQISWIKYCKEYANNIKLIHSCRFMLIDRRLASQLKQLYECVEMCVDEVILTRSYLFSKVKKSEMLVSFRENLYIKFPKSYGVLKMNGDFVTGKLKKNFVKHAFATCLDTRTYDGFLSKRLRKADSKEMQNAIKDIGGDELPYGIVGTDFQWPSTENDKPDTFSWVYTGKTSAPAELVTEDVYCIIKHTFGNTHQVLNQEDQKCMYTLPDFFSRENNNPYTWDVWQDCNGENWVQSIEKELESSKAMSRISTWNKLRLTTKYLALVTNENGNSRTLIMEFDKSIHNRFLKSALSDIRRRVGL